MNSPASWIDRDEVARLLASLGEIAPSPPAAESASEESAAEENAPRDSFTEPAPTESVTDSFQEPKGEVAGSPWVEPMPGNEVPPAPLAEEDEYGDLPEPPPFSLAQSLRVAATLTAVRTWADEGGLLKRRLPPPDEAEALDALPPASETPPTPEPENPGEPSATEPPLEPELEPDATNAEVPFELLQTSEVSKDEPPVESTREPEPESQGTTEAPAEEATLPGPAVEPPDDTALAVPVEESLPTLGEAETETKLEVEAEDAAIPGTIPVAASLTEELGEEVEPVPPPDLIVDFRAYLDNPTEAPPSAGFAVTPLPSAAQPGPRLADRMHEFIKLVEELTEGDLVAFLDRDGHALSFPPGAEDDPTGKRAFVQSITQMARAMRRWGRPLGLDPDTAMHFPIQSEWLCLVPFLARTSDSQSWIYLAAKVPHPIDPFLLERFRHALGDVLQRKAG